LQGLYDFLNSGPGFLEYLALSVVLSTPVVLVHEIGHALVAKFLGAENMRLQAGGAGASAAVRVGGVDARLAPVARPWRLDGFLSFDARRISRFGIVLIAIAGPAASIAAGLAAYALFDGTDPGSFMHDLRYVATFNSVGAGLLSLVPMRLQDSQDPTQPTFATDGMVVVEALGLSQRAKAPRARGSFLGIGPVGWWAVLLLGVCLLVALAVAPAAENQGTGFLIFLTVAATGAWGVSRSSR
jgi:hypothetical protein